MNASRSRTLSRGDGIAVGLIATGAISIAVAALVAIVQRTFAMFADAVTVRMPVTGGDVAALDGVDEVTSATYVSADVTFAVLPAPTRWLLLLEGALPALATIGVCILAWWLGVSLIRSRPFRRSMAWAIGTAAILVMAGGMLGQMLGAFGRAVLVELLAASDPGVTDIFWLFLIQLDLAPLGWGFALALIGGAFEIGQRMQHDTEGLV